MSENTTTTTPAMPASSPAAAAVVTIEHISALHRHLDDVKNFVVAEVKKAIEFVGKEAPLVEAGAAAVAAAVPGVAPIAAAVERVAGEAAALASHLAGHPNTCACPGCVAVNQVNR